MSITLSGIRNTVIGSGTTVCSLFLVMMTGCLILHENACGQRVSQRKAEINSFSAVNKPLVIEIVGARGAALDPMPFKKVCNETGQSIATVYQWKNHLARFGTVADTALLRKRLAEKYRGCAINIYHTMFYVFSREKCKDGIRAKSWDNVLLTANMVSNPKLQKEYLAYHASQFRQWPEVSDGFCHADFQQLVIFRNGRQLMLIISIPQGASLDALNPKTTENNPRVAEWNALMKKYQEGIEGTAPGEVWVFLKPVR